jgi:hypothetical protein
VGIAKELGLRYNNLSRSARAELIEYFVCHPDITMKNLGEKFDTNEWTAARIITRDYFGIKENDCYVILKQSKINLPEPELQTI